MIHRLFPCLITTCLMALGFPALGATWNYLGQAWQYQNPEFSEQKVTNFVQELREMGPWPNWPIQDWERAFLTIDTHEPIDKEIKTLFLELQKFYFGRSDLITLATCGGDCVAQGERLTKKVYYAPHFFNSIRAQQSAQDARDTIAAILAHELGHFVSWLSVDLHEKTIHGLKGDNTLAWQLTATPEELVPLAIESSLTHAEVDFIGLVALKKEGFNYPKRLAEFLSKENRSLREQQSDPLTNVLYDAEYEIRFKKIEAMSQLFKK